MCVGTTVNWSTCAHETLDLENVSMVESEFVSESKN